MRQSFKFSKEIKFVLLLCNFLMFAGFVQGQNTQASSPFYIGGKLIFEKKGNYVLSPFDGGLNSPTFIEFDVNNDGTKDILVFDRADNKLLPYIWKNGKWEYDNRYETYFPKVRDYMQLIDINNQGKQKFISYNQSFPSIWHNLTQANDSFPKFDTAQMWMYRNRFLNFDILYNPMELKSLDQTGFEDLDNDDTVDFVVYDNFYRQFDAFLTTMHIEDTVQIMHRCWGWFTEGTNSNDILLGKSKCGNGELFKPRSRHVGGASIVLYDADNDNDIDAVIGNTGYKNMIFLKNGRSEFGRNFDTIIAYDTIFPRNTKRSADFKFPAGFLVDVDKDGKKDLMVAPYYKAGGKETQNNYFYKNTGTNTAPIWNHQSDNEFTKNSLDFGAYSSPAFFDVDSDGDLDLFVANNGDFEITNGTKDRIEYWENTGSKTAAKFTFRNSDYANVSAKNLSQSRIAFVDADADGDKDLLIGEYRGFVYWYKNTPVNGVANFAFEDTNLLKITPRKGKNFAAPCGFNYNADNLTDLLVGYSDGTVSLYVNQSTANLVKFTLAKDSAYGMRANEYSFAQSPIGYTQTGYAVPTTADLNGDNVDEIILGTEYGGLRAYFVKNQFPTDMVEEDSGWFWQKSLTDSSMPDLGLFTAPAFADLDGDQQPELIVGNLRGGLILASTRKSSVNSFQRKQIAPKIALYPNPTKGTATCFIRDNNHLTHTIVVTDIAGKVLYENINSGQKSITLDLSKNTNGIYFVKVSNANGSKTEKLVLIRE